MVVGKVIYNFSQLTHFIPASVGQVTGTVLVTLEPVYSICAHSLLTEDAFKARLTQASSIDVVTLGSILTIAPFCTLVAVCTYGTFLLAPAEHKVIKVIGMETLS